MDQPNLWWVNQGGSHKAEQEGGFVWAPQQAKSGGALGHHVAVLSVRRDDRFLHYWDGAIRAVGTASSDGYEASRPAGLPSEPWNEAGLRADVEYESLKEPVPLTDISAELRQTAGGLFNRVGGVNQGYLYTVPEGVRELREGRFGSLMERLFPGGSSSRRLLGVYVAQNGLGNLNVGLESGTWGWDGDFDEPRELEVGDYLMLAFGGGGRVKVDEWVTRQSQTLHLGRVTQLAYNDTDLLWPDERLGGKSYSQRIGFELVAAAEAIPYGELPYSVNDVLQTSATKQGRGFVANLSGEEELQLLTAMGISRELDLEEEKNVSVQPEGTLGTVVENFASALRASNIDYGDRHEELVRRFVCSLATKRFLILTGLSGSGKTRIAQAFGEWLGEGRSQVIAVRPDWTSPDYLLGYVNELASGDGAKVWSVPETLEFMLRAARNPAQPHLLILDEMNLAHVERYFADVLSGIESGKPILPNLERNGDQWQAIPDSALVELPHNLFIVGTVNVDETTYMFSPKVLDRANTIEFRVASGDLGRTKRRPSALSAASPGHAARFQADSALPVDVDGSSEIGKRLKELHRLLATSGREFGHRTFAEVLEFERHYIDAGGASVQAAFDVQVCQKILPRLHGSKREIGPVLDELIEFTAAGFPLSNEKLTRMKSRLEATHFVSFAE